MRSAPPEPAAAPRRRRRLARALPWLAGAAGAAIVLHPLLAAPAGTVLERVFAWDTLLNIDILRSLWRNLAEGPGGRGWLDWLYAGRFFFPQPRPLATSELMPLAALAAWPLSAQPVLAHNALLAAALVLDCVAGAALARALGARAAAAAVGGVAFAFSSYTAFQAGRLQLLFLFPVAFALAAALRWARDGRARDAAALVAWTAAQALLCLYYALFLAATLALVVPAARLASPRARAGRDLLALGAAAAGAGALLVPPLLPYAQLGAALGLARPAGEVLDQSGDLAMLLWADRGTLPGLLLRDVYAWDTAYFPGALCLLAAGAATALWVARGPRQRWPVPALVAAGAALAPLAGAGALFAGLLGATACAVVLARRGRASPAAAVLLALATAGLLLFCGPALRVNGRSLGVAPYAWLHDHLPLFGGLRMVRRAGVLVDLAVWMAAALALTRLQARRRGLAAVAAIGAAVFAEGLPVRTGARPVPTACPEPAYAAAAVQGAAAVGEIEARAPTDERRSQRRFAAGLCGTATTDGLSGFLPPLSRVVADSLERLPAPDAHAWLWDAGVRHVVVRRDPAQPGWLPAREARLAPIAASAVAAGSDRLLTLAPPAVAAFVAPAALPGPAVRIDSVECDRGRGCAALADGDERTRWTAETELAPGQTVTARFRPARVAGIEWHAHGTPGDLPRGLDVERLAPEGTWVPWRSFPSLSLVGLGRQAARASLALPLPPATAAGVRLVQTGGAAHYWWSGSELRVVGEHAAADAPGGGAP